MTTTETLQEKLEQRAKDRIMADITKLQNAIESAIDSADRRIKDALSYNNIIEVRPLGSSETFQTGIRNILRKDPIIEGVTRDVLPKYLAEVTQEFMKKVDSINLDQA